MTAEEKLAKIAEIYDNNEQMGNSHARHNLWGALIDLERLEADEVCLKTIRKVMEQLAEIEKYLPLRRQKHEQD